MQPLGLAEWLKDETQFNLVTALSGCGPAYLFRFIDALAGAATRLGLPEDQAARLALATVRGASTLAAHADVAPGVLADRVASPGGMTREGMNVLDKDDRLLELLDRKSVVSGKSVAVRVDIGGGRIIKKKTKQSISRKHTQTRQ